MSGDTHHRSMGRRRRVILTNRSAYRRFRCHRERLGWPALGRPRSASGGVRRSQAPESSLLVMAALRGPAQISIDRSIACGSEDYVWFQECGRVIVACDGFDGFGAFALVSDGHSASAARRRNALRSRSSFRCACFADLVATRSSSDNLASLRYLSARASGRRRELPAIVSTPRNIARRSA